MRLKVLAIIMVLFGSATVNTARAADWEKFWSNFHLVKQRNNAWPQPFLHNDQQIYHAMINPMIERGWQIDATLDSVHFDVETHELNRAGVAKLAEILQTAPRDRQMVYVTDRNDSDVTSQRMKAVESQLANWSKNHDLQVMKSNWRPSPQTGVFVETSYRDFQTNLPKPTLQVLNVGDINASE